MPNLYNTEMLIVLIIYLVIAFFTSSILMYAILQDRGDDNQTNSTNAEKFGMAFVVPALWPLSFALLTFFLIEERVTEKRYDKARTIMQKIGKDTARLKELSTKELKIVYKGFKSKDRKRDADFTKIEQELLTRLAEEHLL